MSCSLLTLTLKHAYQDKQLQQVTLVLKLSGKQLVPGHGSIFMVTVTVSVSPQQFSSYLIAAVLLPQFCISDCEFVYQCNRKHNRDLGARMRFRGGNGAMFRKS